VDASKLDGRKVIFILISEYAGSFMMQVLLVLILDGNQIIIFF
jgi:hypothetical protein